MSFDDLDYTLAIDIVLSSSSDEEEPRNKQFAVRPYYLERNTTGAYNVVFGQLVKKDPQLFYNYVRMNTSEFEELLLLVAPIITKESVVQEPIVPGCRLSLTLRYDIPLNFNICSKSKKYSRYLATGESQKSLSISYKCSPATVHNIVNETTTAITAVLKDKVFPKLSTDYFKTVAAGFEDRWNFPHCIGAIDGKHITIQVTTNKPKV